MPTFLGKWTNSSTPRLARRARLWLSAWDEWVYVYEPLATGQSDPWLVILGWLLSPCFCLLNLTVFVALYRPFSTLRHTIDRFETSRSLTQIYILALFLLDGRKLFTFTGQYNCWCLFRKIKQFHSSKVSFQKRFSSSDHLNDITRNINIYFDYIVAKTRRKNGHHKAVLPADIGKNIIETVVFVFRKGVRLLLKAAF